jgi:hypothetical protein
MDFENRKEKQNKVTRPKNFRGDCLSGNIPVTELEEFSISNDVLIRSYVALAPNAPKQLLKRLLLDEDCFVRFSILENKVFDEELLIFAYENSNDIEHYAIRSYILTKDICPVNIRLKLMENPIYYCWIGNIPNLSEYDVRKYYYGDFPEVQRVQKNMCSLQLLPDDIIKEVLSSGDKDKIRAMKLNKTLKGHLLLQ